MAGGAKGNLYFVEWRNESWPPKRPLDGVAVLDDKSTGSCFSGRSYLIR
jgi:hypothetical protein